MSSTAPPPIILPGLLESLIRALAQKGLTAVAAWLTAQGVISRSQDSAFVDLGLAGVLWASSLAWTCLHERNAAKALRIAVNAPAADPPVKV